MRLDWARGAGRRGRDVGVVDGLDAWRGVADYDRGAGDRVRLRRCGQGGDGRLELALVVVLALRWRRGTRARHGKRGERDIPSPICVTGATLLVSTEEEGVTVEAGTDGPALAVGAWICP